MSTIFVERCAICGVESETRDYLVEGEVLSLCVACIKQMPELHLNARPVEHEIF
jgi:hypothetical protein